MTPLGDGTQGILDASTAVVSVTVRLPEDTSYDFSGIPVVNDATVEGTNFADADAQVAVTPIIPLELETAATKSFDPATVIASPGAAVTAHLGATNRSNATVETLVIQDPVDPAAAPHPFTFAAFTGFGAVTPPTGATGTEYEVFVVAPSTPTPCVADLNPLGTPCNAGAWQLLDGGVAPAAVASLKFVVTMAPGALLMPGQAYDIRFQTRTTPSTIVNEPFPTAWNTVATGGTGVSGGARTAVPATEGRKVGVSYPTGPISLAKSVTGPAAHLAPRSFPVQLTCTSAGGALTGLPSVSLTPGAAPTEVTGLPYGASCTATEGQWGQTGTTIGSAVVGYTTDPVALISVVNDYQVADLTIRKVVETDAVDQRGNEIEYGPFRFSVTCTFLGNEVWADGYDAEHPMTAEVHPAGAWALDGLPVGAECTVTEEDALGAVSTAMDVTTGPSTAPRVLGPTVVVTIDDVDAADEYGDGPFTFVVECTLDTGDGPASVWLGRVTLERDQSTTIDRIATGASCLITETDDGGATRTVIAPGTVTIGDGTTVAVTATNTFDAGSLTVTKIRAGAGAPLWGAGPFEVTLECTTVDGEPVAVPGGAVRVLDEGNGYTATYAPLLDGILCGLEETDAGGATSTAITGADDEPLGIVRVTAGDDIAATVTNTFEVGSLVISKTLSGDEARAHRGDVFEVSVACTLDGDTIEVPGGATRALAVGAPAQYTDMPVGAECAVTETRDGGAHAVRMTPADSSDPSAAVVTIAAGAAVAVTVDNRFDSALAATGADARAGMLALGTALGLIAIGAAVLVITRRRRTL